MQPSLIASSPRHFEDAAAPCPPTDPSELATLTEVFERLPSHAGYEDAPTGSAHCWGCAWSPCSVAHGRLHRSPASRPTRHLRCTTSWGSTGPPRTPPPSDAYGRGWTGTRSTMRWAPGRRATPPTRSTNPTADRAGRRRQDSPRIAHRRPRRAPAGRSPPRQPDRHRPAPGRSQEERTPRLHPTAGESGPARRRRHRRRHAHPGRESRRLKACTVAPGLRFPHAVQAIQIERRRVNHQTGRVQTKTVYAVTSLTPEQAGPARQAELVQDHWAWKLCNVRDVTYGEDASRIRTGTAPRSPGPRSDRRISAVRRRDRSRVRPRRWRPGHARRSPCPSIRRTSPCPS